ncbi:DinB family protein [Flammeovirga yaeyamensis]|uniref:DinB family protein n=1 Tax=Flammeovirga yaeyamensis TaxID=367791 RepID=A0AAX1N1R1_9BACT|nr:DinB family protein [Flammeovirga yaeyamensis]MBB3698249.1 hypothetical protein [Flammeovirga yaeyamensis]NMF34396.1 DinB family protein [Flammeovirga yaeyamensis]QWG01377.1 DinB family protein [Flammeovirga yaeyamensis]
MEQAIFKNLRTNHHILAKFIDGYSLEQLNKIPDGFRNNLIWNIGHVLVAQEGLIYKSSNLPVHVSKELIDKYTVGSVPDGKATQEEVDEIKKLLFSTLDQLEQDLNNDVFKEYHERKTKTGFTISNLNDALVFTNFHEGIHLGVMLSIKKFL